MYGNEPCTDEVDEAMQDVGVRNAIDGGIDGEEEEQGVRNVLESARM